MGERHQRRQSKKVRQLDASRGYFYPGEVVRLLGLEGIEYPQLRRLFRLTKGPATVADWGRAWARFTFRDIAAIRVALDLLGGLEVLERGRRLRLRSLEVACDTLRQQYGLENPLLEARLLMTRGGIVAAFQGSAFVPTSGQLLLPGILSEATDLAHSRRGAAIASGIFGEVAQLASDTKLASRTFVLVTHEGRATELPALHAESAPAAHDLRMASRTPA